MASLAKDISRGGVSAGTSQAINGAIATGLTAAGTSISDALDLTATVNLISTCASGAGVQLPSMLNGDECEVYNGGANQCLVYPDQTTVAINQLSVGTAMVLPQYTTCKYRKCSSTQIIALMSR